MHTSNMATIPLLSTTLLLLFLLHHPLITAVNTTPYFSPTTLFSDYQKMLSNFKVFIYPPSKHNLNLNLTLTPPLSLFYNALLTSNFLTRDPNEANLFFLPFPPQSTRSLARHIQHIRASYPYWDRSLGADHFYLSCHGVGPSSSRNVVELRKNAVQVSCFSSPAREFIPHKDVTLPPQPMFPPLPPRAEANDVATTRYIGYWRFDNVHAGSGLIRELRNDHEFLIESQPSDIRVYKYLSKFCLFGYGEGVVGLGEALAQGCVPVVITDRTIQDLPLMDAIRWSEIVLFVGSTVGPRELKRVLKRTCENGKYERMRSLGVAAAHHFAWNEELSKPYDAFYMVMYQLWLRRHAIRYARWEAEAASE